MSVLHPHLFQTLIVLAVVIITGRSGSGDSLLIGHTPLCRLRGILVACCSQEVTGQPGPAILLNLILDKNCYLQYLQ